ncbi:MAG: hypothetical protein IKY29_02670 [Clostridia bacterium]|nr:hypothetical protein [Clostridia bacterium]
MMLKKILSFALALLIVGSMVACKDKTPDTPEQPDNTPCTHEDADTDYKCDKCGEELQKPACTHEDADTDYKCDKCGEELEKPVDPVCTHEDTDLDYKCDKCGESLKAPELNFTEVDEQVYALVTVELRREPAADVANVAGELRVNEVVTRIGVSEDGEWSKIRYEAAGLEGEYYVASNCLALYTAPEQPGPDDPVVPPVTDPNEFVQINPSEFVYVTTEALNLRTEPSMNGQVVTKLSFGTKLERIAKNEAGWSVVIYEGNQYYLSSDYVTTEDITGSSFVALEEAVTKTVTADVLKKRTSPWMDPTDENVAAYLNKGATVKCVAISPDGYWYRIQDTDGQYYYVGAKYLSGYNGSVTPPVGGGDNNNDQPSKPDVVFTTLVEPQILFAVNKTGGVRVYASPDSLTATVTTLTVGTSVKCVAISTDGEWYKVILTPDQTASLYIQVADLESNGK